MYITTAGIGSVDARRRDRCPRSCGLAIAFFCPARSAITASRFCWRAASSISRPTCVRHALRAAAGRGAGRAPPAPASAGCAIPRAAASRRRSTSWRATAGSSVTSSRSACRCATPCAAPASCSASTRCTSPTKGSSSRSSRRSYADAALDALRRRAGGEDARVIGEVREQPAGAVLATTRYGGTPHHRHAGRRSAAADLLMLAQPHHGDRRATSRLMSSERCSTATRICERFLRARSATGWPRPAARCPSASCTAAGCWRSAAARTPPTRSTSPSNSFTR